MAINLKKTHKNKTQTTQTNLQENKNVDTCVNILFIKWMPKKHMLEKFHRIQGISHS